MDWGSILGSVVSAGSGGILGIAGSLVSGFFKGKQKKAENAFKQLEWDQEARMMELNMKADQVETENELELARSQGSYTGLEQSLRAEAAIGPTHMIVSDLKALFRPFLTLSLWGMAAYVFIKVVQNPSGILTEAEVLELIRYMVYSVFFCASTATTWWFGDRALQPPRTGR